MSQVTKNFPDNRGLFQKKRPLKREIKKSINIYLTENSAGVRQIIDIK